MHYRSFRLGTVGRDLHLKMDLTGLFLFYSGVFSTYVVPCIEKIGMGGLLNG